MKMSEFIYREVINISDGDKIGFISDIDFDRSTGNIEAVFVPDKNRKIFSSKNNAIKIPWDNIKKIGDDIILVDVILDKHR